MVGLRDEPRTERIYEKVNEGGMVREMGKEIGKRGLNRKKNLQTKRYSHCSNHFFFFDLMLVAVEFI